VAPVISPFGWRTPYLRAVHYFGRAQPLNFWDSAILDEAPAHLAQIRRDGFNAVILVVPWRGFQRTVVPSTFDDVNLARLRRLVAMVQAAGLQSIVRISFPWNNDPESVGDFEERTVRLFSDREYRKGWLDYVKVIRRICEAHAGFRFAFFSWEEFPSLRELMVYRTAAERLALAEILGFRDYLAERFDLAEISRLFGKHFANLSEVYVPLGDCEAYRVFVDFVNHALGLLLADARTAWPRLAIQLRVDMDRMEVGGENIWIDNDLRLRDGGMRVTYFFPSMYTSGTGLVLSAAQVLANLTLMLRRVTDERRNTRHFIDQFIFHDESPQFASWARIKSEEIPEYLLGSAALLKRYSRGFAFWNYRDYRVNHLYNAAFIRGLQGWQARGGVTVGPEGEPRVVTLAPGAAVSQRMQPDRVGWGTPHYETMRFAAKARTASGTGRLKLTSGGVAEVEFDVGSGEAKHVEVAFPADRHRDGIVEFAVENIGAEPVEITDLCLWGFVYRCRLYDEHGHPGEHLAAVRAMLRV